MKTISSLKEFSAHLRDIMELSDTELLKLSDGYEPYECNGNPKFCAEGMWASAADPEKLQKNIGIFAATVLNLRCIDPQIPIELINTGE